MVTVLQFSIKVMNLNHRHSFVNIVAEAGYISEKRIASANAVVFSYVLYLIVKYDYKLDASQLEKCISKWFFMRTITYFYTGSTESEVEKQFADLRDIHTADEFITTNAINSAAETGRCADESYAQMEQVDAVMNNVVTSSQEIGRIIATIDSIAFQTNILALNAAVDADNAGAAGKSFSVVAEDVVRSLAAKSDEAVRVSKELIENSI